ncbi:Methylmalonyl-CoA mutase, partial [mine drainage metagenome]
MIPGARVRYLAEIAEQGRGVNARIEREAEAASKAQSCYEALREIGDPRLPRPLDAYDSADLAEAVIPAQAGIQPAHARAAHDIRLHPQDSRLRGNDGIAADRTLLTLHQRYNEALKSLSADALTLLREWPARKASVTAEFTEYQV